MKYKIMTLITVISLIFSVLYCQVDAKSFRKFSKSQDKNAQRIAKVVADNWEKYGCLPSVAIAQAFIESTLGEHCTGYNLWGIRSGAEQYDSLDDGIYRYMRVINNGYYKGAPFCKDYKKQIRRILDGGYCTPEGEYYNNVIWTIQAYGLYRYDEQMFKKIKSKSKSKKSIKPATKANKEDKYEIDYNDRLFEPYTACNNDNIDKYVIYTNRDDITGGAVYLYDEDKKFIGIYEVVSVDSEHMKYGTIIINNKELNNKRIYLKVYEDAVG